VSNLSFKGNMAQRAGDELASKAKVKMPWFIGFMDKLRVLKGETGGIIINALGTGLVAPIFIAFNPLSKADEDTKKYTAMRQPVSAALAILIQAGLTKPLSDFYDYLSNTGKLGKSVWLNQQKLNSEGFLKRKMKNLDLQKEALGGLAKSQMAKQAEAAAKFLEKNGTINVADGVNLSNSEMKSVIDKTLTYYQNLIDIQLKERATKNVEAKVNRARLLINPSNEETIKKLSNEILKCENLDAFSELISKYSNSGNSDLEQIIHEFKERGRSIESVQSRAKNTIEKIKRFNERIDQCKYIISNASDITAKLNEVKDGSRNFKTIVNELRMMCKNPDGTVPVEAKLLKEYIDGLSHRVDEKSRKEYAQKIIDRVKGLKKEGLDKLELVEIYQRAFYRDCVDDLHNQRAILESMKVGKIKDDGLDIKQRIKAYQTRITSPELKSLEKTNFLLDTVKTFQKTVDKRFKGFKQITNILIGLFVTLPITCHALNWCYPRFMDIFFPNLSKNDKSEAPEEKAAQKAAGKEAK